MQPDRTRCHASSTGYTLVELVLVIAILAIVAAFAAPRFFDQSTFDERGYADALGGALRAAQKAAIATGCNARVQVDASGYRARLQAASGNACDPADTTWSLPVALPDGDSVQGPARAAVSPSSVTITFDAAGVPVGGAPTLAVGAWRVTTDATTGYVAVGAP